jgi:hypothetical protein
MRRKKNIIICAADKRIGLQLKNYIAYKSAMQEKLKGRVRLVGKKESQKLTKKNEKIDI